MYALKGEDVARDITNHHLFFTRLKDWKSRFQSSQHCFMSLSRLNKVHFLSEDAFIATGKVNDHWLPLVIRQVLAATCMTESKSDKAG